uniref:Photosystem II n=1 Tax=Opuntia streptacantha TaxID=393608 RepID=A0A7C8YZ95_OPUST
MAATMATMAVLNAKCMGLNTPKSPNPSKPVSLLPLPKGLATPKISSLSSGPSTLAGAAIAGAIFSTLGSVDPALAAQQIAEIAEGDNRGLALLLPIVPAIGWVLYKILQPALNQLNRMRSEKGVLIGLGLGGLAASGLLLSAQQAQASEIAMIAENARSDNRGQLLLFVILPAIGWVLYNILQPALNQLNRMRSQ